MAIIAKASPSASPIMEGPHVAICTRIADVGDQFSEKFNKSSRKIIIFWELDESYDADGKSIPRMIHRDYTLSLHERSTLRQDLEAWRGRSFSGKELEGFDLKNVLGACCMIQIIHDDKGYARIKSIMSLPKNMVRLNPSSDLLYLDFDDPTFMETFEKFPEWVRDRVKLSPQYKELVFQLASSSSDIEHSFREINDDDEELPF